MSDHCTRDPQGGLQCSQKWGMGDVMLNNMALWFGVLRENIPE